MNDMSNYFRNCPKCGKKLEYKSKSGFELSNKNKKLCRSCCQVGLHTGDKNPFFGKKHSEETKRKMSQNSNQKEYRKNPDYKKKMSKNLSGSKNPMFGKTFYGVWVEKYGKEEADARLLKLKEKQKVNSSGKNNPMYGRQAPNGSGNGWSGWYKKTYFRSLRELAFIIDYLEQNNLKWQTAENIKIKYINFDGKERTYAPDFLVENKFIIEIKPEKLHNSPSVQLKKKAAEEYCLKHQYEYMIIDVKQIDFEKIKIIYESNLIKFLPRYEEKFKLFYKKT